MKITVNLIIRGIGIEYHISKAVKSGVRSEGRTGEAVGRLLLN